MKNYITTLLIFFCCYKAIAQENQFQEIKTNEGIGNMDSLFMFLDKSPISSGYLIDKYPHWNNPSNYDGTTDSVCTKDMLMNFFLTINRCKVGGNFTLPDWQAVDNQVNAFMKENYQIPIVIIDMNYEQIQDSAIHHVVSLPILVRSKSRFFGLHF